MNRIRKAFAAEVACLEPVLHEMYRRIGVFQKDRSDRNRDRLVEQLDRTQPHLAFFASEVPSTKRPYFDALADAALPITDRIIALDVAVGSLHIGFPVERSYMHRESAALRAALDRVRWTEDAIGGAEDAWLRGVGASPGRISAAALVVPSPHQLEGSLEGLILVTDMLRPESAIALKTAAGIITEQGGMLCHAAIAAREFGVPCVVGVDGAVSVVESGDRVVVDGASGDIWRA